MITCKNQNYAQFKTQQFSNGILQEAVATSTKGNPTFSIMGIKSPVGKPNGSPSIKVFNNINNYGNGSLRSFSTNTIEQTVDWFSYYEDRIDNPENKTDNHVDVGIEIKQGSKREIIISGDCDEYGLHALTIGGRRANMTLVNINPISMVYDPLTDPLGRNSIDNAVLQLSKYIPLVKEVCNKNKNKRNVKVKFSGRELE
jgi:hypothetical protein